MIDVAIVGGGVSGVYVAWRLVSGQRGANSPFDGTPDIHIYELSDRIGGRLLSESLPEMDGIYAEFGGMRFKEFQKIVWDLVNHLGLRFREFPVDEPESMIYVRGRHVRYKDLEREIPKIYNLRHNEIRNVSDLTNFACRNLIPDFYNLTAQEFEAAGTDVKINGIELYKLGWWDLLVEVLSQEAIRVIFDTGGYNTSVTSGNAHQAMSEPFYWHPHSGQPYHQLTRGYEYLPTSIHREFEKAINDSQHTHTHFEQRLVDFEPQQDADGPYVTLTFEGADGIQSTVQARHLVLAMPRFALEKIDTSFYKKEVTLPIGGPMTVGDLLETIEAVPAFKVFMGYCYPWWKEADIPLGRSTTDLPIRQCYYWETRENIPGDSPSLLMATYNDTHAITYWEPLRDPKNNGGVFRLRTCEGIVPVMAAAEVPEIHPASNRLVENTHRMLMEMFGVTYAPEPYVAMFRDWQVDPFGAGWWKWKPGYFVPEIVKQMRQPVQETPVYITGSAYSTVPGWVQGALNVSERLLQEKFGLMQPDWLSGDYYLGP